MYQGWGVLVSHANAWNMVMWFVLSFVVCFIVYYTYYKSRMTYLGKSIPGPKPVLFLGNALHFLGKKTEIFKKINGFTRYYGDTLLAWIGPQPMLITTDPNVIEDILSSTKYLDKSVDYTFLHDWLGTGLLTSTGRKWHSHRKVLTPTFHFKILEQFVDVFNKCSKVLVENLKADIGSGEIDVFDRIAPCTLDIILETAMGISLDLQNNMDADYIKAVYSITDIIHQRHFRLWIRNNFLFNLSKYKKKQSKCLEVLHGLSNRIIRERKMERKLAAAAEKESKDGNEETILGQKKRLAFLDLLIEASKDGEVLTDEEIREEVDTFMFEGHDTTATGISFTLYSIGAHPDVQEEAVKELSSIFGDSDRPATMQDLNEMKYLERCIKEALRLYPSVPLIARKLKQDMRTDNVTVPAGTTLGVNVYMAHRNEKFFPDPEKYNPDNFLPERVQGRHPYSYIPFSAGPRNCIGQKFALLEEKVVISTVLRNYRIEAVGRPEDLELEAQLVLKAANGVNVKLYPRTTCIS